jgi:PAS domain S-box-containing protein
MDAQGKEEVLASGKTQAESGIHPDVFAKAFAINPAAICVARYSDGRIMDVNASWQEMFGYSREEAIGHSALELDLWLVPQDRDAWVRQMHQHASVRNVELTVRRKSGEQFVTLSSAEILAVGNERFVLSTWLDISHRKEMEEELRDSKEYLERIINCLRDPVVVKDPLHRFVLVNEAFLEFVGKSREEVIGETAYSLLPREKADFIWAREEETLNQGIEQSEEIDLPDKDGTIHTMMVRTARFMDKGGNKQFVAVLRDISDYRRLQEQFLQSQKMEAIGKLAGGVAHDFNNMLNVINGYCELMFDELGPNNPLREDLNQISLAGKRASALTTQLLAFSRKQIMQPEILNLNALITTMNPMLRRLIREDIDVITIADPQLGRISADPMKMQQVIMNLVVNAGDAMPEGGTLTIETANVALDAEYARKHVAVKPGPYVLLAISDNGAGMDEETRSHLFEPFFTTKVKGKGTGLGLSTVYGIVKQSNGFIWVYSEPGKGTTFKIYLPRIDAEAKDLSTETEKAQDLPGTETVLVVEDEPAVRGLTTRILRERGYTVLEASNGAEALDIAQTYQEEIHLLITDVIMPGLSGRDLSGKITASRPGIRTLFVSGYTDNAIVHHGILDADVSFLQKPFSVQSLCLKVRETLDSRFRE